MICSIPSPFFLVLFTPVFPSPARECRLTKKGVEYSGKINSTKNGLTCQRWDSQSPRSHSYDDDYHFPENNVSLAENFCRNPSNEFDGPWCYTIDGKRWESCDIPWCQDPCAGFLLGIGSDGVTYRGQMSYDRNGVICQPWSMDSPHSRLDSIKLAGKLTDTGETFDEAKNYCRNPDNETVPWCYTMNPHERWNYCEITRCDGLSSYGRECKVTKKGVGYFGKTRTTKNGLTCQRWDSQAPHAHLHTLGYHFPENDVSLAENFCRNPSNLEIGPWCYTTDPNTEREECDIPWCAPFEGECSWFPTSDRKTWNYTGQMSYDSDGFICQQWNRQFPHSHIQTYAFEARGESLHAAENFCRNPDNDNDGPWCYRMTTDSGQTYGICNIKQCTSDTLAIIYIKPRGHIIPTILLHDHDLNSCVSGSSTTGNDVNLQLELTHPWSRVNLDIVFFGLSTVDCDVDIMVSHPLSKNVGCGDFKICQRVNVIVIGAQNVCRYTCTCRKQSCISVNVRISAETKDISLCEIIPFIDI